VGLDAEGRSLRGSIGGNARWAREDPKQAGEKMRDAQHRARLRKAYEEAAARGEKIPQAEAERRAAALLREHMNRMVFARHKKRMERKARGE